LGVPLGALPPLNRTNEGIWKLVMNVFVLCTGRCGSTTFAQACRHITNYTSGHESNQATIADHRVVFPDNHIEVDNRLAWMLGRLDVLYGDGGIYVHLLRDEAKTAASFARRCSGGIISAYRKGILQLDDSFFETRDICKDYCDTVTLNIQAFLKGKTQTIVVRLENVEDDFVRFWHFIGAEGNLASALAEWNVNYNASGSGKHASVRLTTISRWTKKLVRLIRKLPWYIKWA
jgi:hypothetical protein